jgi:hypothetical protein
MPRVIVTTNLPPAGDPDVLLDEHVSTVHLASNHAAGQLIERLSWAIHDAERAELERIARPLLRSATASSRRRGREGSGSPGSARRAAAAA